jgi:hypothetical protein
MLCRRSDMGQFGHDLKPGAIVLIDPFLVTQDDAADLRVFGCHIEMTTTHMSAWDIPVQWLWRDGIFDVCVPVASVETLLGQSPKGTEEPNCSAFYLGYDAAGGNVEVVSR